MAEHRQRCTCLILWIPDKEFISQYIYIEWDGSLIYENGLFTTTKKFAQHKIVYLNVYIVLNI